MPYSPEGVKRLPEAIPGLRIGTVRVPKVVVEPGSGIDGARTLVTRLLAIDPGSGGEGASRFWFDADGDGDLTNDVVSPDREARAFARSNEGVSKLLTDFSTGTIRVADQRRQYVWARHADTGKFYLFLAATSSAFDWRSAFALHVEVAPVLNDVRQTGVGALGGVMRVGPRESPGKHLVLLTPPAGEVKIPSLLIDRNADSKLDETPISLERIAGGAEGSIERWTGSCTLLVTYGSGDLASILPMEISLDVRPPRPAVEGFEFYTLTYRGEWGRRGAIDLGAGPLDALLFDEMATGDYRGSEGGNDTGVRLLIDLNKNGKFDREEAFDPSKPFQAMNARWLVRDLAASGASFRLERVDARDDAGDATPKTR